MAAALFHETDRYEVISEIGRGGMGVVYKAKDKQLHRVVAIKQLLGNHDFKALERLEREARAVAQLRHKNIVQVFDMGQSNGHPYMVLEFVDGEAFDELLDRDFYELPEIVELICKICEGVLHAHEKGVVHRDIKPNNILISREDGEPKLLDFGLAQLDSQKHEMTAETLTEEGSVLGSIRYMSPEQANGERADEKTDIWALGAILYEALTKTPIFEQDKSFYNSIVKIIKEPVEAPILRNEDCPEALSRICMKALEKERTERFQSVAELKGALEHWLENPNEGARGPQSLLFGAAFILGIFAVLSVAYFMGQQDKKDESKKVITTKKTVPRTRPAKSELSKKPVAKIERGMKDIPSAFQGLIPADFPWVSPLFFDVNGDGCDDIISVVKSIHGKIANEVKGAQGFVTAFDGHTGKPLWQVDRLVSAWGRPCLYQDSDGWRIAGVGIRERNLDMFVVDAKSGKCVDFQQLTIPEEPLGGRPPVWPLAVTTWEMGPQRDRLIVCYRTGTNKSAEPARIYFWNQTQRQTLVMAAREFATGSQIETRTGRDIYPWWSESDRRHIGFLWVCNGSLIGVKLDDIKSAQSVRLAWSNSPLSEEQKDGVKSSLIRAYFVPVPGDRTRLAVAWYKHRKAPTVIQLVKTTGEVLWTRAFPIVFPDGDNPKWLRFNKGELYLGLFDREQKRDPYRLQLLDLETGETKRIREFASRLHTMGIWVSKKASFLAVSSERRAAELFHRSNFESRLVLKRAAGDAFSRIAIHDLDKDGRPELILSRSERKFRNAIEIVTPKIR